MKRKKTVLLLLILLALFSVNLQLCQQIIERLYDLSKSCSGSTVPIAVVIDAGHGGSDPGKVGVNHALEKDINLAIALDVNTYLTAAGYTTAMTRKGDHSLADGDAEHQKLSDFNNRTAYINSASPAVLISIHQNSYPDESVFGAQVFYAGDEKSRLLASSIQEQCRRILDSANHRQIKENPDYYLFRHTSCPAVIVECGFLSNPGEAGLLLTREYQQKVAWAIYMGTVRYFNNSL